MCEAPTAAATAAQADNADNINKLESNVDNNAATAAVVARPAPKLTRRDWLLLLLALALAALFCHCFDLQRPQLVRDWREGPGLAFCLFLLGGLASSLWSMGAKACYSRENKLLLAVWLALALSFALTADPLLRRLNMLVLLVLTVALLLSLAGLLPGSPWSVDSFGPAARRFLPAPFRYWPRPVRAVLQLGGKNARGPWRSLLLGLLLALPLLALALALLSSADAVFRGLFDGLLSQLQELRPSRAVWLVIRTLALGLAGFSILYTLVQPPRPLKQHNNSPRLPLLSWLLALGLLDVVYLVFVVIQFAFLFGGAQTAAISGGYAAYAREGFFQLVAVSLINLGLLALAQRAYPRRRELQIGGGLLLACTLVILVSAAWRMRLYVLEYGLTTLRLLTFWAMLMLLLALALAALKLWRPQRQLSRLLLATLLVTWLGLNYCGPDIIIAEYNVNGYIDGSLQQVDEEYLMRELSPAAYPSLQKLQQHDPELCRDLFLYQDFKQRITWADWSLPWLLYVKQE